MKFVVRIDSKTLAVLRWFPRLLAAAGVWVFFSNVEKIPLAAAQAGVAIALYGFASTVVGFRDLDIGLTTTGKCVRWVSIVMFGVCLLLWILHGHMIIEPSSLPTPQD